MSTLTACTSSLVDKNVRQAIWKHDVCGCCKVDMVARRVKMVGVNHHWVFLCYLGPLLLEWPRPRPWSRSHQNKKTWSMRMWARSYEIYNAHGCYEVDANNYQFSLMLGLRPLQGWAKQAIPIMGKTSNGGYQSPLRVSSLLRVSLSNNLSQSHNFNKEV